MTSFALVSGSPALGTGSAPQAFRAQSFERVLSKGVSGQRWQGTMLRLTEVGVKHDQSQLVAFFRPSRCRP